MSIALRPNDRPANRAKRGTAPKLATAQASLASSLPGQFLCTAIGDSALSPARMKSLGICAGRPLELISTGDPMIVRVCGTNVGLSRQLAAAVTVTPLPITADI
jgi:Fe2+ transport system protein FeoA